MTKSNKIKSIKYVVFFATLALALLCIVVSIGKYLSAPWDLSVSTQNIVAEKHSDNFGVVVDKSGKRLMYLDANNNVVDIKSSYTTENDMYFYSYVDFDENYVFVKEYCYHTDTHFIKNEKIVKYAHDGTKITDVASFSYDLNENYANIPRVKHLTLHDGHLYFTYCDMDNKDYAILSVDTASNELRQEIELKNSFPNPFDIQSIYTISYEPDTNILIVTDSFGNLYNAKQGSTAFENLGKNLVNQFNTGESNAWNESIDAIANGTNFVDGKVYFYSIPLALRIILFWLSVVFLLSVLLVFAVKYFKKISFDQALNKLKFPVIIVIGFLIAGGVIFYINENNEQTQGKNLDNQLTQSVLQQNALLQDVSRGLINTDINAEEYKIKFDLTNKQLQNLSLLSARGNISINYVIYKYVDGNWLCLVSSSVPTIAGINDDQYVGQNLDCDEYGVSIGNVSNVSGNYKFASVKIYDEHNNVIGSMASYKNVDTADAFIEGGTAALMLGLISFLIVLSFLLMELTSWLKTFVKNRRASRDELISSKERNMQKECSLIRPIRCLNSAATSADSVIGVIIFQEMLVGTPLEGNMIIIALPMTFTILGRVIGVFAFGPFIRLFGAKKTLIFSSLISCFCLIACGFFVASSMIIPVSFALLVNSFFLNFVYLYIQDIPAHVKDKNKRKEINNNSSASSICGSAIITLITGYVSVQIGSWCVYLCAAAVVAIIFAIVLFALPKHALIDKKRFSDNNKTKGSFMSALKFAIRPDILLMIFSSYAICVLISGYKSFIFPLFATMNNVSKSDVSNISVFANALAFYITPLFTSVQKRFGTKNIISVSGLMAGIIFIIFVFNCTFLWACLAYLLVQLICKFMWPSSSDYWQDAAIRSGTESSAAVTATTTASNLLDLSKNGVMGALMGFGTVAACVVIGVYSIVTSCIFAIFGKSRKVQ